VGHLAIADHGISLGDAMLARTVFFGLMLLNFSLGFVLATWSTASFPTIRVGRQISLVLWVLAGLASLRTVTGTGSSPKGPLAKNDDGPQ